MALSANILAALIQTNLAASGANGKNLEKFCTGVATGIIMSIVGKTFTTSDIGTVPGAGTGIGVGITGLSSSNDVVILSGITITTKTGKILTLGTTNLSTVKKEMIVKKSGNIFATIKEVDKINFQITVDNTLSLSVNDVIDINTPSMVDAALRNMSRQGVNAPKLMKAIMDAVISHLSIATLSSINTPVFTGTGTIDVGSFNITANEMSNNIDSQLKLQGANGSNRTNLATAIGNAVASNILSSGTGSLTITGSASGIPVPGTGTGTGVIT